KAEYVARELDHGDVPAEADAEIRGIVRTCVVRRDDHAVDATLAEAARHDDAIDAFEYADAFGCDGTRIDVAHLHARAGMDACVLQRFDKRLVGIEQFHVLADPRDGDFTLRFL